MPLAPWGTCLPGGLLIPVLVLLYLVKGSALRVRDSAPAGRLGNYFSGGPALGVLNPCGVARGACLSLGSAATVCDGGGTTRLGVVGFCVGGGGRKKRRSHYQGQYESSLHGSFSVAADGFAYSLPADVDRTAASVPWETIFMSTAFSPQPGICKS